MGDSCFMARNLKRYHRRGDLHFITSSCYQRRPLLETVRAQSFFEDLRKLVTHPKDWPWSSWGFYATGE